MIEAEKSKRCTEITPDNDAERYPTIESNVSRKPTEEQKDEGTRSKEECTQISPNKPTEKDQCFDTIQEDIIVNKSETLSTSIRDTLNTISSNLETLQNRQDKENENN